MPALFIFLLKVNAALLLFCAGYYLVLRHLTFYTLNRVYLVGAIVFATAYPKINLSGFAERHQQIAKPVQTIISNWQAPAAALVKPITKPDYWYWAEVIFWVGVVLLVVKLLSQLYSIFKLYRNSASSQIDSYKVRLVKGNISPFSFGRNIYINPEKHQPNDLKAILLHEQIHIDEWHTADIILAELSTIFYWFNPGVWLIKKAVRENIEFITDRKTLISWADPRQYQYSLLNVSFASYTNPIANHFNISSIRKRILMMNTVRSSNIKLTRYICLIPLVLACLFAFSFSKNEILKKSKGFYKKNIPAVINNGHSQNEAKSVAQKRNIQLLHNKQIVPDSIKKMLALAKKLNANDSVSYFIDGSATTKTIFQQKASQNIIENVEYIKDSRNPKYPKCIATSKKATDDAKSPVKDTTENPKPRIKSIATDSVVIDKRSGITRLYGKAGLDYKDKTVRAEYIEFNDKTKKGLAKGTVTFTNKVNDETVISTASEFSFSLDKQ
jgi:hypothetical protein